MAKYLGINFRNTGAESPEVDIGMALERIGNAPLKPQQRLIALRTYLLPRYVHGLVLGGSSRRMLADFDITVRGAVRRWLKLPRDIPTGYFHAPCAEGGLGVPSMSISVPALVVGRLQKMERSGLPGARAAFCSGVVARKLRKAREALARQGLNEESSWCAMQRRAWWAERLHSSNDGKPLCESAAVGASTAWLGLGSLAMSGGDFVQYVRTHINALPTTVRMSRGRREGRVIRCRAGCLENETGAHAVQKCYVSHGGRVLRHDAVVRFLGESLSRRGYDVYHETTVRASGRRWRPDLIAVKEGRATIVDAQIVGESPGLDALHRAKSGKYGVLDVRLAIGRMLGVPVTSVGSTSCTLSWRGVWSGASAKAIKTLGLSNKELSGVTTRVLKGSSIVFSRWRSILAGVGR